MMSTHNMIMHLHGLPSRKALISIFSLLIFMPPHVTAAWFADASVEYRYNDNQPNGDLNFDVHQDQSIETSLSVGNFFQLTDFAGAGLSVDLTAAQHLRFTELSHVDIGISSFLQKKFGLGYEAPVLSVTSSISYNNFRNRQRDAWKYTFGAGLAKRFADRWQVLFNFLYENQNADHFIDVPFAVATVGARGNTFDLEAHSLSLTGVYDVNRKLSVFAGYTRREGDVVSSTNLNFDVFLVSTAIAFDPVFGDNIVAYTVDGDSNIFSAGASWALTPESSLNLDYERRMTTAPGELSYDNNIINLAFLYAF